MSDPMRDYLEKREKDLEARVTGLEALLCDAQEEIALLRIVAEAGEHLCENIRNHGVHDNWKTLANALRAVPNLAR